MSDQLKTPKAARRKVTTDLGRQVMQRERSRLAREQAALGEQLAEEARRKLVTQQSIARKVDAEGIAVTRSIVKRAAAVLQTEGVNATIRATKTERMSAYTDFDNIVVNYRWHDDLRMLAATMRGLIYHEGGHCRFTIPFKQLVELTGQTYKSDMAQFHKAWNMLEDQRMETAVASDSPRKAAYLTPMLMTELTQNINMAAANYPLLIWRRYLPRKVRRGARRMFVAKHNLMGLDGEALAKGWERVVTEYVMADTAQAMWTAVLTAHELLKLTNDVPGAASSNHDRQDYAKQPNLDDALVIPVSSDMLTDDDTVIEDGEQVDIDTTNPAVAEHLGNIFVALFSHPETLLRVVYVVPQSSDEKSEGSGSSSMPGDDESDESDDSDADEDDASDSDSGGAGGSSDEESEDESEEGEGEGEGDDGEDDDTICDGGMGTPDDDDEIEDEGDDDEIERHANDGPRNSGKNPEQAGGDKNDSDGDDQEVDSDLDYKPEDDSDDLSDDDLSEALAEAEAERYADEALTGDVHAFQDALDSRVSDLTPYVTHASKDLEATAAAHNLANELEQSFYSSTMDKAPQWVEGQRRGIINVIRYMTRQPADMEFFRQWTEDDQQNLNMAVSVLLDYSGSMSGYTEELAQAGYATKLACEKLGVPCTVVLWDSSAKVLWDANERAEWLPVIESAGSTDPGIALADLPNQRYEKAQHIVLIMTDGEWSGHCGNSGYLAPYMEQGRLFIGCGFNSGYGSADMLADKLRRYGCDESYAVKTLMEIPALLEQTLVAVA